MVLRSGLPRFQADRRSHDRDAELDPARTLPGGCVGCVGWRAMQEFFDLNRFVQAQDPVLAQARLELSEGRKRSHWSGSCFRN